MVRRRHCSAASKSASEASGLARLFAACSSAFGGGAAEAELRLAFAWGMMVRVMRVMEGGDGGSGVMEVTG